MTIKVGYHGFHPGLAGDEKSSDPNHFWLRPLFDYLESEKHEIHFLGNQHSSLGYKQVASDADQVKVDVGIFYWRWAFGSKLVGDVRYHTRQNAWYRQWDLIRSFADRKIPMIIFNGDHKMTLTEIDQLQDMGALLVEPSVYPQLGFQTLHYPYVYHGRRVQRAEQRLNHLIYVGNNYDRYTQAKRYLGFEGKADPRRPEIHIWGNWLEPSSLRQSPDQVLKDFPHVRFMGRSEQRDAIRLLSEAAATIHLAPAHYMKSGFIALRWQEAVAAKTPALLPAGWKLPRQVLGDVYSRADVRSAIREIDSDFWRRYVLESQTDFVVGISRFERWLDAIEIAMSSR